MPTGGHFSKFLLDGAEHVQAPVLPLPLRLAAIYVCAAIISGGILGGTISGVIPDATRGCVVRIGVFYDVLIAVRLSSNSWDSSRNCLSPEPPASSLWAMFRSK